MDPNATLDMIRSMVAAVNSGDSHPHSIEDLAEYVEALDEWMSRGGYLPADWERTTSSTGRAPRPVTYRPTPEEAARFRDL